MNASERIASAFDTRWYDGGDLVIIIEDWAPATLVDGSRFVESSRTGGHYVLDLERWDGRDIVLPR